MVDGILKMDKLIFPMMELQKTAMEHGISKMDKSILAKTEYLIEEMVGTYLKVEK